MNKKITFFQTKATFFPSTSPNKNRQAHTQDQEKEKANYKKYHNHTMPSRKYSRPGLLISQPSSTFPQPSVGEKPISHLPNPHQLPQNRKKHNLPHQKQDIKPARTELGRTFIMIKTVQIMPKPLSILIIEDNHTDAILLKMAIQEVQMKTQITISHSVGNALSILFPEKKKKKDDRTLLDLIVTDLNFNGLNAFTLIENMQTDPEVKDIPIICTSIINDPEVEQKLNNMGIPFVSKAQDIEDYGEKIRAALRKMLKTKLSNI